jgi:hypothetical protein
MPLHLRYFWIYRLRVRWLRVSWTLRKHWWRFRIWLGHDQTPPTDGPCR